MYFLQLFDWYAASISLILVCLIEVVIIGWIYGVDNFIRDIEFMIGCRIEKWWCICWKYVTPIILSVNKFDLQCKKVLQSYKQIHIFIIISVYFRDNTFIQYSNYV